MEPFSLGGSMKGTAVAPARVVAGKYRLLRLLGRGGMGTVYMAEHVQVGRPFALKFLLPDRSSTPRYLRRFEREAELLGRLEHENVVSLHDIGVDATEGPYLVLEYVRGVTLREELDHQGVRPPERLLAIVRQMARGLAHAHALGIVHRDLKPENVMLAEHANGELLVKLLDFGVAGLRSEDAERVTMSDVAIGTAAYMAPEQARGDRGFDARTDVYALGVITYEALSGVRPYTGDSYNETLFKILHRKHRPLSELRPELPEGLVLAVERALSKAADARFDSVEAFVRQLEGELPHQTPAPVLSDWSVATAEAESPVSSRVSRRARRGRPLSLIGLGAVLGYALALVLSAAQAEDPPVVEVSAFDAPIPAPAPRPPAPPTPRPPPAAAPDAKSAPVMPGAATRVTVAPRQRVSEVASAGRQASARPAPLPRAKQTTDPARAPEPDPTASGYIMNNPYPNVVGAVGGRAP